MELLTLPQVDTPAEWLAWDEALLEAAEGSMPGEEVPELLWFWESNTPFLVLGYGQKPDIEANVNACEVKNVLILRRFSGGGAVVQGAGCLNYSLVLGIRPNGLTATIAETNSCVMERNRRALATLLNEPLRVCGHTDLAIFRGGQEHKISGNAQRRKRRALLFHGTVLLNFDLSLMARFLRPPSWAPEYRAGRTHTEFVINTDLSSQAVRDVITREWIATPSGRTLDRVMIRQVMEARYGRPEWHAGR